MGDLPFYVALDGTAFTYHKELFKVDEEGKATVVGGCPPDAFAEDGQVFNELHRGMDTRKEFFTKILEVVSVLGGEQSEHM